MSRRTAPLLLTDNEKKTLTRLVRSTAVEKCTVRRANILLMMNIGMPATAVADELGNTRGTVHNGLSRYHEGDIHTLPVPRWTGSEFESYSVPWKGAVMKPIPTTMKSLRSSVTAVSASRSRSNPEYSNGIFPNDTCGFVPYLRRYGGVP